MPSYKAVVFDMGGVCVGSPFAGIAKYEKDHGLPEHYINIAITKRGHNGAFQRLERGELAIPEFYDTFGAELSDPINKKIWIEWAKKKGKEIVNLPENIYIDGKILFRQMMKEAAYIDLAMLEAIKKLRVSEKFKLAALTNNFVLPDDPVEVEALGGKVPSALLELFDEYIESSVVKLRKPDPRIFQLACNMLKVKPSEVIFLDDIDMNLRAARDIGITAIKVELGNSKKAIKQLQELVGLPLLSEEDAKL